MRMTSKKPDKHIRCHNNSVREPMRRGVSAHTDVEMRQNWVAVKNIAKGHKSSMNLKVVVHSGLWVRPVGRPLAPPCAPKPVLYSHSL